MPTSSLPFERIEEFDRVTYRLPRQPSALLFAVGVLIGLFSLFPIGMAATFVFFVLKVARETNGAFLIIALIFGIFPLFIFTIGLAMLFLAMYLMFGRDEVVLDPKRLRAVMVVGPLRWSRGMRRERLRQVTVVRSEMPGSPSTEASGETHGLRAEDDRGRKKVLLRPYPYPLVRALADDLARRSGTMPLASLDIQDVPAKVLVGEDSDVAGEIHQRPEKPASSLAIVEPAGDGLRIILPAKGFWRGSSVFAKVFVVFWCTILSVMISAFTYTILSGGKIERKGGFPESNWFLVLFFTPFVLVGIGGILTLIHLGRRKAEFTVSAAVLIVERWEWFREQRDEWRREDIQSIRADATSHVDSESHQRRWVYSLRVNTTSGDDRSILANREKSELEWLATTLRATIGSAPNHERIPHDLVS